MLLKAGEDKAVLLVRDGPADVKLAVVYDAATLPVFRLRWDEAGVHLDEPSEVVEGGWEQMSTQQMAGSKYLFGPGGVRFEFTRWRRDRHADTFPVIIFPASFLPEDWSASPDEGER